MATRTPKTTRTCQDCQRPFEGGLDARYGPCCRWKQRGRRALRYGWTSDKDAFLRSRYDSRIRRRTHEIARALGWPVWVIKKRSQLLGIAQPWPATRRTRTAEETALLEQYTGQRHVNWIAKRLNRP